MKQPMSVKEKKNPRNVYGKRKSL